MYVKAMSQNGNGNIDIDVDITDEEIDKLATTELRKIEMEGSSINDLLASMNHDERLLLAKQAIIDVLLEQEMNKDEDSDEVPMFD